MRLTDFLRDVGPALTYYPRLCPAMGGLNATILLCRLIAWTGSQRDPDGWIYKSHKELTAETGLSRHEQEAARSRLVALGLVETHKRSVPPTTHYRVSLAAVDDAWEAYCRKAAIELPAPESGAQVPESGTSNGREPAILTPPLTSPQTTDLSDATLAERIDPTLLFERKRRERRRHGLTD